MTLTSFKNTAAWLGDRGWKILHTVGMYYLWLAFIYTFGSRIQESVVIYLPFVLLLAISMLLRLLSLSRSRLRINN